MLCGMSDTIELSLNTNMNGQQSVSKKLMSKPLRILASIAVSICILGGICVYRKIDFKVLVTEGAHIDTAFLLLIVIFSTSIHIFVGSHKLWRIMTTMGSDITYVEVLMATLGGGPLRLIMPLDLGSMVNVMFFCRHKNVPFARALGAVAFNKGSNFIGLVFWLSLALALIPESSLRIQASLVVAFKWLLHSFPVLCTSAESSYFVGQSIQSQNG